MKGRRKVNNCTEIEKEMESGMQLSFFESVNRIDALYIKPKRAYQSMELFAGAGGMTLGLERAGFEMILVNEPNKQACETLRLNRPLWNIKEENPSEIEFKEFKNKIDLLAGGFPCQPFSYAGKYLGFEDVRGTTFFEFARAVKEVEPKLFLIENVKGLLSHNGGKTLSTITEVLNDLGYTIIRPKILKAIYYRVPQKLELLVIIGVRNDMINREATFKFPTPYEKIYTIRDALKKGELFNKDVPFSKGASYAIRKQEILDLVPPGGCWVDLPLDIQKEYMKGNILHKGGQTGMARRLAWDSPCLTLTSNPTHNQTERCYPDETRPLRVREYARIQTFPDDWEFAGSMTSQYKQIGNAVPVNLAYALGLSVIDFLNKLE